MSVFKLLIFLVALSGQTQKIHVRAQSDYSQCYNDIYLSDQNGDGKVDSEEYVEFCRLRLEERLELTPDGHTYDKSSANIESFVMLPSSLQSNFYWLACLCSRFDFDDVSADKSSCCVGDNAHLSVVHSIDSSATVELDDEELQYNGLLCSFTNRAVDNVIGTMETVPPTTIIPTAAPTTDAPTSLPTASPSMKMEQPTTTPTAHAPTSTIVATGRPSLRTTAPSTSVTTMHPTFADSSTSSFSSTADFSNPTNVTIKASYSILVEEKEVDVDYLNEIHDDCVEGMNLLATKVSIDLELNEISNVRVSKVLKYLFVETSIDKIEELGFTSTPELIDIDDKNNKVFAGGPCPVEMETGEKKRKYNCFGVTSSINLGIVMSNAFTEPAITPDDVRDLYSDVLEQNILEGRLPLQNYKVIMATGQVVSETSNVIPQTKETPGKIGIIVGVATGALLLLLVFFYCVLRRRKQMRNKDEKETVANPDEDPEARNSPSSKSSGSSGAANSPLKSKLWQHHRSPQTKVPYFQDSSPGSKASADDTKSIGGISAESEAGWSDVYTSSMGSVSDDGVGDLESPPPSGPVRSPVMSPSSIAGLATQHLETEGSSEPSPVKQRQIHVASTDLTTPPRPTSLDGQSTITPVSPITPKSIQVLEETQSEDGDEIMVHEDFSDEEEDEHKIPPKESSQETKQQQNDDDDDDDDDDDADDDKNESPEEFRAKIHDLIERIVPEEIDRLDDMIAEFKGRENELVNTLLAMEKRTLAQWRNQKQRTEEQVSPPSPEREEGTL